MGMQQNFRYLQRVDPVLFDLGMAEGSEPARALSLALDQNRLSCAYQPVAAANGVRVAFYECLARLRHSNGDIPNTAQFLTDVDDPALIARVDCAILDHALSVLAADPVRRLSVNLSPKTIGNADWLATLEKAVARDPICGELLIVEITESALLTLNDPALEFLRRVRQLGCSIAIDDFGAGHSSLQHLGRFRFDFLKIDGAFIRDIGTNEDHQFLVRSMVNIARHFEMVTVAEMVSNDADRAMLSEFGIDCVQGFGIGKPELRPDWLRPAQQKPGA